MSIFKKKSPKRNLYKNNLIILIDKDNKRSPRKRSPRKRSPRKRSPRKRSPRKRSPRKRSPRRLSSRGDQYKSELKFLMDNEEKESLDSIKKNN